MAAWRTLVEAHAALMARLEDELEAKRRVPLAWYEVLLRLSETPEGRLRMSDLAASVLLSKSGLTRLVDRMEAAGLVRRQTCPVDRRGAFAVITGEGRAAFRRAAAVHLRGIQEHFGRYLTEEEADALASILSRVRQAAGTPPRNGAPAEGSDISRR